MTPVSDAGTRKCGRTRLVGPPARGHLFGLSRATNTGWAVNGAWHSEPRGGGPTGAGAVPGGPCTPLWNKRAPPGAAADIDARFGLPA